MRFTTLTERVQNRIKKRFQVPTDTSKVYVMDNEIPYELYGNSKVVLSVKLSGVYGNGFHIVKNQ